MMLDSGLSRRHDGSLIVFVYASKDQSWSHKSVRTRHTGLRRRRGCAGVACLT